MLSLSIEIPRDSNQLKNEHQNIARSDVHNTDLNLYSIFVDFTSSRVDSGEHNAPHADHHRHPRRVIKDDDEHETD